MTPEEQEEFLEMKETIKTITETNRQLQNNIDEKIKREKELEEHNQKLFLRITKPVEEEQKDDEEETIIKEHLGDKVFDLLSNKDKENLKIIMNGDDE